MAYKAYLPDGRIVCSSCKSEVKETDNRCEICLSLLEVSKEAMECPYCQKIIDRYATICEYCGKVVRVEKPKEKSDVDEEFLLKLLDLGKKVEKETPEDLQERTKALEVIKAVAGVMTEKPAEEKSQQSPADKVEGEANVEGEKMEALTKEPEIEKRVETLITIPENIREDARELLASQMPELKKKIESIPSTEPVYEAIRKFLEQISVSLEQKLGGKIEKDLLFENWLSLIKENLACVTTILEQYHSFYTMQNAVQESLSKTAQSSGKISKKEWLAAQKQVQAELFKVKKELDEETERRIKKATKKAEEEIEKLRARIDELTAENEKLKASGMAQEEREELRKMLKTLDDLLGDLPDEKISEFAKSEMFKLYEKIMDRYKVGED